MQHIGPQCLFQDVMGWPPASALAAPPLRIDLIRQLYSLSEILSQLPDSEVHGLRPAAT